MLRTASAVVIASARRTRFALNQRMIAAIGAGAALAANSATFALCASSQAAKYRATSLVSPGNKDFSRST